MYSGLNRYLSLFTDISIIASHKSTLAPHEEKNKVSKNKKTEMKAKENNYKHL
jgi:hypothetical protein